MSYATDIAEFPASHDGEGLRIGIIVSRFNPDIGQGLLKACVTELKRLNVAAENIRIATVPGALEIALCAQNMARSGHYDALIALGAVIRGHTYHFELVSNEMGSALSRVALDCNIAIANGVLTTHTDEQALARTAQKGLDCAQAAIEMTHLLRAVKA